MSIYTYGWKKDQLDKRDYKFSLPEDIVIPDKVDLRTSGFMPGIYDQGQLGSCTANGIGGAIEYDMKKQGINFPNTLSGGWFSKKKVTPVVSIPSRLLIYYNERALEGTVKQDSGAAIRDGIKVINSQGVCSESLWNYDISKFKIKPPSIAYKEALLYKATNYQSINQVENDFSGSIASGYPVIIGISVYSSLESQQVLRSGIIPMPNVNSEQLLGGHCVLIVGYDRTQRIYILRNSWGTSVGQQGYFTIPFDYILDSDMASDFWNVQLIGGKNQLQAA